MNVNIIYYIYIYNIYTLYSLYNVYICTVYYIYIIIYIIQLCIYTYVKLGACWVCIDCLLHHVYQQFELNVLDLIQNSYSSTGGFHRSTHECVGVWFDSSSGEYMKNLETCTMQHI